MERRLSQLSGISNNIAMNVSDELRRRTTQILEFDERKWRWSFLKEQFRSTDLEELIKLYTDKISLGYFSLFLILYVIISISHFFIVFFVNMQSETMNVVLPDLILYAMTGMLSIVGLFISENYVKRHPRALIWASVLAFSVLYITDFGVPVYHYFVTKEGFRPSHTTNLVIACYIFLTIRSNCISIALGAFVTCTHMLILTLITYKGSQVLLNRVGSDLIYYLCINGLGIYFRLINEIIKRRGFLDRRTCVDSNVELNYEKEQEEHLLSSIIPNSIIDEVKKDVKHYIETSDRGLIAAKKRPYIESHNNVTILYADIVNFTQMTTQLTVTQLLETLNDLFGSFDVASELLNVMRIKFLGDCYYCVGGLLPNTETNHADACVDLGLNMIKIIRRVRERRNLDIDMRIGIHTGQIWSGVIGISKWQFDIWSKDVLIANKMETTGCAGKVHITKETKDQLKKTYNIVATNKGQLDPLLKQNGIETFLVHPNNSHKHEEKVEKLPVLDENGAKNENVYGPMRRFAEARRGSIIPNVEANRISEVNNERRYSANPIRRASGVAAKIKINDSERRRSTDLEIYKRRTAFMDNNINRYHERLATTNEKMKESFENLPLAKYDQWLKETDINPFLLLFKNWETEKSYILLPDPLFRYYIVTEIVLLASIILIQTVSMVNWDWTTLMGLCTIAFLGILLIPLTWTHYIWNSYNKPDDDDDDAELIEREPTTKFVKFFYNASKMITKNVGLRTFIYIVLCIIFTTCVLTDLLHCNYEGNEAPRSANVYVRNFLVLHKIADESIETDKSCIVPWHMTETCALAIIMSFVFLKIHLWLKFLFGVFITSVYSYYIWNMTSDYYENSETINYMVQPSVAHIITMVYLTFTLHLVDRQSDYMNRLDHKWNQQLIKEQIEKHLMRKINSHLLQNILPKHVAELYLNVNRPKTLYYEQYENIAVMFASILNFNLEEDGYELAFTIFEEIVSDFDKVLLQKYDGKIEKIKMANWTYMAASGLEPGRRDSRATSDNGSRYVITLLEFAVDLIKTLTRMNEDSQKQYALRIGISNGPVTAGVVGSKKPLYDIWGDTVNMASRMDSTGQSGKIQVTEETSVAIENFGRYLCEYRGHIVVKGKLVEIPTYFVELDSDNNLVILSDDS